MVLDQVRTKLELHLNYLPLSSTEQFPETRQQYYTVHSFISAQFNFRLKKTCNGISSNLHICAVINMCTTQTEISMKLKPEQKSNDFTVYRMRTTPHRSQNDRNIAMKLGLGISVLFLHFQCRIINPFSFMTFKLCANHLSTS